MAINGGIVKAAAIAKMSRMKNSTIDGKGKGFGVLLLTFWIMILSVTIVPVVLTINEAKSFVIDRLMNSTESNIRCEVLDMANVSMYTIRKQWYYNELKICIGLVTLFIPSKSA